MHHLLGQAASMLISSVIVLWLFMALIGIPIRIFCTLFGIDLDRPRPSPVRSAGPYRSDRSARELTDRRLRDAHRR